MTSDQRALPGEAPSPRLEEEALIAEARPKWPREDRARLEQLLHKMIGRPIPVKFANDADGEDAAEFFAVLVKSARPMMNEIDRLADALATRTPPSPTSPSVVENDDA